MIPNFYQQVVILVYILIFTILCIFFVPFGTNRIYYDSIFSDEAHLVTFRFLTEILIFTIPAVILYKVSANSQDPNYSLVELLTFKNKKSFWLYSIVILFIVVPYSYIQYKKPSAEERSKMEAEANEKMDSLFDAASQEMTNELDSVQNKY